ncbi:flavin reductase [candidate division KSB1 bacterium]
MEHSFKKAIPELLEINPFSLIGADWMLITAGPIDSYNTMTASWGGLGHLWDKNITCCFIRPQRYTFGFIEKAEYYTFSFFGEKYRYVLNYCGNHSGKNVDKAEKTGITPVEGPNGTVYFAEARLVIVSKKLYTHDLDRNNILEKDIIGEFYPPDNDIHTMYIGEVTECMTQ